MAGVHATIKRLGTEQRNMMKVENRVADLFAEPLDGDIFQWHFTIKGPSSAADGTAGPYAKGIYHGALIFSHSYPFAPPDIVFFTPNGRFQLDMKICSTISSYHKELWQPTYDINFILLALRLFMGQDDEVGVGAIHRSIFSPQEKERMAEKSWSFQCPGCGQKIEDIYNTHMAPYPETSEEKKSQVPTTLPTPSPSTEQTTGGQAQQTPLSAPDSSSMSPVVTVPESATSPTIPEVTPQGPSTSNSDAQQASSAEVATPQGDGRVVAEVAGSPDVDLNAGSPTEAIPRSTDHVQQNVGEVVVEEVAPQPLAVAANDPNVNADVPANEPPEVQVQVARWTLRFSMDRIDVVFKCCTTVLALILLRRVASWLLVKGGAWLLHIGLDYFIR